MLRVVDPHIHFWNRETHRYPWMETAGANFMGPCEAILRTHVPSHFRADAQGVDVLKVVHVEAAFDPSAPLKETRWLQSLADAAGSGGMPQGIVAYADLASPDADALLAAHAAHRNVRGIRQILNVHADPYYDYVGRHFMHEPQWRRGFALLEKYRLSFDLQIYPSQMPEAVELARAHAGTTIVLNHTGMFVDRSMFASNFPVDRLYSSYAALWSAYAQIVADATPRETDALLRSNAQRIYRI
jgi:predicted TIM-barrel fold metal-dependent hydrolase